MGVYGGLLWDLMGFHRIYPLVMTNSSPWKITHHAIKNGKPSINGVDAYFLSECKYANICTCNIYI